MGLQNNYDLDFAIDSLEDKLDIGVQPMAIFISKGI
jgi:hypothetical protein